MSEIQPYIDAFAFLVEHTALMSRFSVILVVSILMGALVLDRFRIWRWSVVMFVFLVLTQYQVNSVLTELGYTGYQVLQPHVITVVSALFFMVGSGIGYLIKMKFALAYAKHPPAEVAEEIVTKVNGGEMTHSVDPEIYQNTN